MIDLTDEEIDCRCKPRTLLTTQEEIIAMAAEIRRRRRCAAHVTQVAADLRAAQARIAALEAELEAQFAARSIDRRRSIDVESIR